MRSPLASLILAAFLAGSSHQAGAWSDGKLLLWINSDKGSRGLAEVGRRFETELAIPVKVETPENVTDKFQQAAQSGKGPDIFFWAHDRVGEFADAGLLRPVRVRPDLRDRFFPIGWEALSHRGKIWGYPVAFEAASLIYNRKLIDQPPGQLADIAQTRQTLDAAGRRDVLPLLWDYNNPYFSWGLLASGGAYIFGGKAGGYDTSNIGVAAPGAVKALDTLVDLVNRGVIPRGATYSIMEQRMNSGELAMMISGPWAWKNLRKSGIDFGLAPVPGVDGNPGRPFIGVLVALINRSSPNADLAEEFLEHYALTPEGLAAIDRDVPLGVPALREFYETLAAADDRVRNTMVNVQNGQLMPNIPEMGRFWSAMSAALQVATTAQATPAAALEDARRSMQK